MWEGDKIIAFALSYSNFTIGSLKCKLALRLPHFQRRKKCDKMHDLH